MKKVLTLIFAVLMAVASVRAEEPVSITPLHVSTNSVYISNPTTFSDWDHDRVNPMHYTLFEYTAQSDGSVVIYSEGEADTFGALFDENMNYLEEDDDSHVGYNFELRFEITEGDVYYIGVRSYEDYVGDYAIVVEEKAAVVATIGDKNYYSLAEALMEVETDEPVTLQADIDEGMYETDGTITLDLNGHALHGTVYNSGKLTIVDGSESQTGSIETEPGVSMFVNIGSDNTVIINGGTFVATRVTSNVGMFYINGGTFTFPIGAQTGYFMSDADNIVFGSNVVYRDLSGENADITEVTKDITYSGTFVRVNTPTLHAGTNSVVIGNPTTLSNWNNDRQNPSHYTIFEYTAPADGIVTIYSEGGEDTYGVLYDKNMIFLGGNDDGDRGGYNFELEAKVKGGEVYYIGARSSNYNQIGEYTITVEEKTTVVATIGDVKYYSLVEACQEVGYRETVTLQADVVGDLEAVFEIYGTFTLDLNGHTLQGRIVYLVGNLTIVDGSESQTGRIETTSAYCLFDIPDIDTKITINGGTFVGGQLIPSTGLGPFYLNGGTFILADGSFSGYVMNSSCAIVFGDGVVYRDLSGEHDDITEVTEDITYSGTFVRVNTPTLHVGSNSVVINNPTTGDMWNGDTQNSSHYTIFEYTASADGIVTIYADGGKDTYGALYDKNMFFLGESDESSVDSNFELKAEVRAGDVLYVGARGYYNAKIGEYTITVDLNTTVVATIGDKNYNSLAGALETVKDGETVTLQSDVVGNLGESHTTYGTFTLDLNGHTLQGYISNVGHLTIEDSSEGKTGEVVTRNDFVALCNENEGCSITINGGTFVGGCITSDPGIFYINGGTFILAEGSTLGYTMSEFENIVFGEDVVYRDLSGEHDDITEVTESVRYSGTFVNTTATAIKNISAPAAQKAIKTIENGRIVIICDGDKWDLSGRKL